MRVGGTGGTGVLGRRVVHRLIDRGHQQTVLSRRAPRRRIGPRIIEVDIRDQEALIEVIAGQDAVAHLATSPFRSMRSVEFDGTRSMVAVAGKSGVRHLLSVTIVGADRIPLGTTGPRRLQRLRCGRAPRRGRSCRRPSSISC